jgi:protein-disulfide isomerase
MAGKLRLLGGLVGIAALVACGTNSADIQELKKGQEDILAKLGELDKSVKAVRAAPAAPARPEIDPNKVYDIPVANSPLKGPRDAKVTIVKFSDYQCPFCAQSAPLVDEVLKAYPTNVNFVYKQFPLTTIHPNAMPASKAALAAGKQGKYWEMHELLFKNYRALGPDDLKKYAGEIGLNVPQWEKDMASPEIQAQIDQEMQQARAASVQGTPTFFVGGKRLMNRSVDGFKQMIDAELNQKKG